MDSGKKPNIHFEMPDIASGTVIPPKIEYEILKEEARKQTELRRFIITTVIGAIAAVASIVAAAASILALALR